MFYSFLFIFSFILTYLIKEFSIKKSLLAEVTNRSSHMVPTPHGGGIAIAISFFIGILILFIEKEIEPSLFYALLSGILLSVISYVDDIHPLSFKVRLFVQSLVALSGLYFLGGFNEINFFFTIDNPIITNIFAFFLILWFINLYNFIDGIDGYAGTEALFLAISGFILFGSNLFLVIVFSVLGFLFWNWNTAKIFMGDVGSTLLGYIFAILTIYYSNQDTNNFWIWIVLFSLFWFDATLTLYRRYKNGDKLSEAHNKHGYQRLYQFGWKQNKIVLFSIIINIILFSFVYFIPDARISFLLHLFLYIVL